MTAQCFQSPVIRGELVILMSSFDWQEVRRCRSAPGWVCVQWEHRLSLLGGQAVSAESVPGQGLSLFWVTVVRYSATVYYLLRDERHNSLIWFLVVSFQCAKWFSFRFLIIWFCLKWWLLRVGQSPRTSLLRGHFSECNSLWVSLVVSSDVSFYGILSRLSRLC